MLYFVCFIFWYSVIFDYFCNDFIVDLFTENKEIVIIILFVQPIRSIRKRREKRLEYDKRNAYSHKLKTTTRCLCRT